MSDFRTVLASAWDASYPPSILRHGGHNPSNLTHNVFGTDTPPATVAALKADPVHGDTGTGKPANGAAANDPAFDPGQYVNLGAGVHAYWDGNAWQAGEAPAPAPPPDETLKPKNRKAAPAPEPDPAVAP
jgi:hypothetical protein